MDDGEHKDCLSDNPEEDTVREYVSQRTPDVQVNRSVTRGTLDDAIENFLDCRGEPPAEPRSLSLIPIDGLEELNTRLYAKL